MALFLAMVLAWVGGARTGAGNLGEANDRGLAGAFAERAEADAMPLGKPSSEESSETNEAGAERELEEGSPSITGWNPRVSIEIRLLVGRPPVVMDDTSTPRARLLLASIRARGPPVG